MYVCMHVLQKSGEAVECTDPPWLLRQQNLYIPNYQGERAITLCLTYTNTIVDIYLPYGAGSR